MKYTKKFVIQINEVYHDIESGYYQKRHPEIFKEELERWQKEILLLLKNKDEKVIFDLGTGTGFVPFSICSFLKKNDTFICSDISKKMLNVCKEDLKKRKFNCKFKFVKIKNQKIPYKNSSAGILTLNSVLHHLPDTDLFFNEAYRILKPGGYLVISHEPNNLFYNNFLTWTNYKFCSLLFKPQNIIIDLSKKIGLYEKARKFLQNFYKDLKKENEILNKVNQEIIKRGLIKENLSYSDIIKIIDIHSPTAGILEKNKGFNVEEILKKYSGKFRLVKYETYNHILELSNKNKLLKVYNSFLKRKFPKVGATLFFILQKTGK